jgi:hypothetical protein
LQRTAVYRERRKAGQKKASIIEKRCRYFMKTGMTERKDVDIL